MNAIQLATKGLLMTSVWLRMEDKSVTKYNLQQKTQLMLRLLMFLKMDLSVEYKEPAWDLYRKILETISPEKQQYINRLVHNIADVKIEEYNNTSHETI